MYKYLVSRWVDPIIGVGVGVCAYYLHEQRQDKGQKLNDIIRQKLSR